MVQVDFKLVRIYIYFHPLILGERSSWGYFHVFSPVNSEHLEAPNPPIIGFRVSRFHKDLFVSAFCPHEISNGWFNET